jgi:hypothetical protein
MELASPIIFVHKWNIQMPDVWFIYGTGGFGHKVMELLIINLSKIGQSASEVAFVEDAPKCQFVNGIEVFHLN